MDNKDDLVGKFARLPDGQRVKVEKVHSDGQATVRRTEGERRNSIAVCAVKKLLLVATR